MNIRTALQHGTQLFEKARIPAPRLTAEVLLASALNRERSYLYSHPEDPLPRPAEDNYARSLDERLGGKPTQYITSRQEFYGREFLVTPDVFIPRPETEHVVEAALKRAQCGAVLLDVGCGSGAIAVTLSLEMPGAPAEVWATDNSRAALRVAAENARKLGARISLIACDLISAITARSIDVLVSNPPYVPIEEEPGLPREVREHEGYWPVFKGESFDIWQADRGVYYAWADPEKMVKHLHKKRGDEPAKELEVGLLRVHRLELVPQSRHPAVPLLPHRIPAT